MGKADLHIHTTASDGRMSPEAVLRNAKETGVDTIAITDHDTIRGYQKAKPLAVDYGIDLISGIEISSDFNGRECHLLAYFFDADDPEIKKMVARQYNSRLKRAKWIINELSKEGLDVDIGEVKAEANGSHLGRPHIAAVLVDKGYVSSFKSAFIRYLSDEALGQIYNEYYTHKEVIDTVKGAGGAVVIAHPGRLYSNEELELLSDAGVDGIEFMHPSHNYETQQRIADFADEHKLLKTGGSDFHGADGGNLRYFGVITLNTKFVERMRRMTRQRKKINS